jgi:hypothetical protein
MDVGQVSFKDPRRVKRVLVPQRENAIINRLNKTKVERKPDLQEERDEHLKEGRRKELAAQQLRVCFFLFLFFFFLLPAILSMNQKYEKKKRGRF